MDAVEIDAASTNVLDDDSVLQLTNVLKKCAPLHPRLPSCTYFSSYHCYVQCWREGTCRIGRPRRLAS